MPHAYIALLWRKPDITLEEFKHYYETVHIPLAQSLLGPHWPDSHTRYYLPRQPAPGNEASNPTGTSYPATISAGTPDGADFDAIAYLFWEDEDQFKQSQERRRDPEVVAKLQADEENFLVREKLVRTGASEPFVTLRSAT